MMTRSRFNDLRERDHALAAHRLADHRKCVLPQPNRSAYRSA
jgi:hypothetical protein